MTVSSGQPGPVTEQPYLARRQNWTNQLARHALMQPGATAMRFLGRTTTWRELDGRVTALASALHRRGVEYGDRVLILMLNRTEFIESFLAINKLGAIAVPVNFRMTPSEIAFLVADCQARVVITESVLAQVAAGVRGLDTTLATVIVAGGAVYGVWEIGKWLGGIYFARKADVRQNGAAAQQVGREDGCRPPNINDFRRVHDALQKLKSRGETMTYEDLLEAWREVLCN